MSKEQQHLPSHNLVEEEKDGGSKMKALFDDSAEEELSYNLTYEDVSVYNWQLATEQAETSLSTPKQKIAFFFESWQKFADLEDARRVQNRNRQRENRKRRVYNELRTSSNTEKRQKPYLELLRSKCIFCGKEGGDQYGRGPAMQFKISFHEYSMKCVDKCEQGEFVVSKSGDDKNSGRGAVTTLDAKIHDCNTRLENIMEKVVRLKLDTVFSYVDEKEAQKRHRHLLKWFGTLTQELQTFQKMKTSLLETNTDLEETNAKVEKYIQFIRDALDPGFSSATSSSKKEEEELDDLVPESLRPWSRKEYIRPDDIDGFRAQIRDVVQFVCRGILPEMQKQYQQDNKYSLREFRCDTGELVKSPLDFKYTEIFDPVVRMK